MAKKRRIPFTEDEINQFISKCRDIRERLCVIFLFDTGARKNELRRLRRDWVMFDDPEFPFGSVDIKIRDDYTPIPEDRRKNVKEPFKARGVKTKTDRLIPLTKRLCDVLKEFYDKYGNDGKIGKHETYINELFARLTKDVGTDHKLFPHLCRHTYITAAVSAGAEPHDLTDFTGHSGTKTLVDTYLHGKRDRAGKALKDSGFLDK